MLILAVIENPKNNQIIIRRGFAFRGQLPPGSLKSHICIILNKKVIKSKPVYYVYITSKGEKVKARLKHDPQGIVKITKSEYPSELKCSSYIQCSKLYVDYMTYKYFVNNYQNGTFDINTENPPKEIIDRITETIVNSKTFSMSDIKEILD